MIQRCNVRITRITADRQAELKTIYDTYHSNKRVQDLSKLYTALKIKISVSNGSKTMKEPTATQRPIRKQNAALLFQSPRSRAKNCHKVTVAKQAR